MSPINSNRISSMRGFTLIEVAIASTIAMSTVIFGLYWMKFNAYVDQGRSVGQQYITLNDAVNNYIVTHSKQLAAINPACSETTFAVGTPGAFSGARQAATCGLTIAAGKNVANALQPTASELITLGFLPPSPPLPNQNGLRQIEVPNIKYGQTSGGYIVQAGTSGPTPFRLFINIETICLQKGTATNPNTNPAASMTPEASGCPTTTTTAFKSLIFNTQLYADNGAGNNFNSSALFASVMEKIGNDALSSGLISSAAINLGDLYGKNFFIPNPISYTSAIRPGNIRPGAIIAIRGGYGAAYAMQHSRTDGSNPPTANWDFGAYEINNVNIDATNIKVNEKLKFSKTRIVGDGCDMQTESIAVDADNNSLTCKQKYPINASNRLNIDGIWTYTTRIMIRTPSEGCKLQMENVAVDVNNNLLTCKQSTVDGAILNIDGIWSPLPASMAKGTVDFSSWYEVLFAYGNGENTASFTYCENFTDCSGKNAKNIIRQPQCVELKDAHENPRFVCSLYIELEYAQYLPIVQQFRTFNPTSYEFENHDMGYSFVRDSSGNIRIELFYVINSLIRVRFYKIVQ